MKKIWIVLAAGIIAFAFAGCGNGQATTQEAVDSLADAWVDVASLEEAETLTGFTVEIPSGIELDEDVLCRYCDALKELEVQFSDPYYGYLRKAKDNGDISGDYQKYPEVRDAEVDGIVYTLKGPAEGLYNLVIWKDGDFSYCIGLDEPESEVYMMTLATELK